MSDPDLESLAEAARNRGLKLIRSRVRTPGKRRFGQVGLADLAGKAVFGLDAKGPNETPIAVEEHLRGLGTGDWGASLGTTKAGRTRVAAKSPAPAAEPAEPASVPPPAPPPAAAPIGAPAPTPIKPPPKPVIREAKPGDAPRLVELIHELGHEIDEQAVRRNLVALKRSGEMPLLATLGREVIGMCGISRRIVVHRPAPLGRITALIVTKRAQRHGIGRMLVDAAEAWMRKGGCQLVEVTSNDRRADAHAFYDQLGYQRTSARFVKTL